MMNNKAKKLTTAILCLLFFSACGEAKTEVKVISGEPTEKVIQSQAESPPTPMPTTSAGTPINKDFHPDVEMIDTPNSTCFSAIGWDAGTGTLVVTFRDSGASYAYDEVSRNVWDALRNADSMGGYYNKNIKGHYDCVKLG